MIHAPIGAQKENDQTGISRNYHAFEERGRKFSAINVLLSKLWGKHVLVAYIMKPKAGYDYLATAAHFAAESSTGTNVNVCTTDDFTKSVDALVYYIDPDNEEMKIAYPTLLFDRNITDGRGMMCSFLTLAIGNNQGILAWCFLCLVVGVLMILVIPDFYVEIVWHC